MTTPTTSMQLSPSVLKTVNDALTKLSKLAETQVDECDAVQSMAVRLLRNTGITTEQLRDVATHCFNPENEEAGIAYSEMLLEKISVIPLTQAPEQMLLDIFAKIDSNTDDFDQHLACLYSMVGTMTAAMGLTSAQFTAAIKT